MKVCVLRPLTLCFFIVLLTSDAVFLFAQQRYWIFFNDKKQPASVTPQELGISERALQRRAKTCSPDQLIDCYDYPVDEDVVQRIRQMGVRIVARSRWLNAVSVVATDQQHSSLARMSNVTSIRPVLRKKQRPVEIAPLERASTVSTGIDDATYGSSLRQVASVNAVPLHRAWVTGKNVVIGMLDDGFNNHREHNAFRITSILGEYDFVQRDENTSRAYNEYAIQGNHGAQTLSVIGGYEQGKLVGVAYGASFYLAKTEIDSIEVVTDEDYFIEGLEWLERQGVDIVSASLGYDDFDPTRKLDRGNGIYDPVDIVYAMKDGRTAPTTRAVQIATRKGILVVVSAGNEGWSKRDTIINRDNNGAITSILWGTKPGTGSITTPADADSILAVGALSALYGTLAGFSSTGPTADGRWKPDVVAQGTLITAVDPRGTAGYVTSASGTSFAAPLVAGAAALVLSAHPSATAMEVRNAILSTAKPIWDTLVSSYPNNYYGYGRVDALEAALSLGPVVSNTPSIVQTDSGFTISVIILSKTALIEDSVLFYFHFDPTAPYSVVQFHRVVDTLFSCFIPSTNTNVPPRGFVFVKESSGRFVQRPIGERLVPQECVLFQNYPNPFNSSTTILFDIGQSSDVELAIFSIHGQRVRTLVSGWLEQGRYSKQWDGTNDGGGRVASGVYIYRLKTPSYHVARKMLYIK